MESGHEARRYVHGHAVEYNHEGQYVTLNLNDIYPLAAKVFQVDQDRIMPANG